MFGPVLNYQQIDLILTRKVICNKMLYSTTDKQIKDFSEGNGNYAMPQLHDFGLGT